MKTLSLPLFSGWLTEALLVASREAMFLANTGSTSCLLMDPKSSLLYDRRCHDALNGEELLERWCAEFWRDSLDRCSEVSGVGVWLCDSLASGDSPSFRKDR